jgi:hypothetical protein
MKYLIKMRGEVNDITKIFNSDTILNHHLSKKLKLIKKR